MADLSPLPEGPPQTGLAAQLVLDALQSHVAVVDRTGTILSVNRAWENFAVRNGGDPSLTGVGCNYLQASAGNPTVQAGLRQVLAGERGEFELTYPCHAPHERRWFRIRITPLHGAGDGEAGPGGAGAVTHALIEHQNVSREARGQEELHHARRALQTRVEDQTAEWQRRARSLADRAGALEAFAQFTEAAATTTEPQLLARHAEHVLRLTLGDVAFGYYERAGERWTAQSWSADLPPGLETRLRAGFRADLPVTLPGGAQPTFLNAWPFGEGEQSPPPLGATALLPLTLRQPGDALLVVASLSHDRWSDRARTVFRAVGRSFNLALERAEQARHLAEQGDRLAELNAELTAYTASLSRDLRDPARRIAGFAGLVEQRLPEDDVTGRRHLGIIRAETGRLQTLVEDLAQLRPLQERTLTPAPLALAPLVVQVRSDLTHYTRSRRIVWNTGALPTVQADHLLLRQVLTQLLHNAVKFTAHRDPAQIEVGGQEREADVLVWVRDNGVGFEPGQTGQLFRVFTRLHGDAYDGTGVGLANVRRIIHRHGGQVWAEGQPDRGATFFFTLPREVGHITESLSRSSRGV